MVASSGGPQLPFHKTFVASAIAACTAEIATLPLGIMREHRGRRVVGGAVGDVRTLVRCPDCRHRQGEAAATAQERGTQVQVSPAPLKRRGWRRHQERPRCRPACSAHPGFAGGCLGPASQLLGKRAQQRCGRAWRQASRLRAVGLQSCAACGPCIVVYHPSIAAC
jgi:hypothetical protein